MHMHLHFEHIHNMSLAKSSHTGVDVHCMYWHGEGALTLTMVALF